VGPDRVVDIMVCFKEVVKTKKKALVLIALIALVLLVSSVGATTSTNLTYGATLPYTTFPFTMADANTMCIAAGGTSAYDTHIVQWTSYDNSSFYDNTDYGGNVPAVTISHAGVVVTEVRGDCVPGGFRVYNQYIRSSPWPTFNWSATPLTGPAPLTAAFTIQNSSHSYTATFGDGQSANWTTELGNTYVYTLPGTYTVTVGIRNGSTSITRTNYITVSPQATGNVTTYAKAIDSTNGNLIYGAAISMYDITNQTWSNTTSAADGTWGISTKSGRYLNIYGYYTGNYSPGQLIGVPVGNGGITYNIMMSPNSTLPAIGSTNLYVSVIDADWTTPIKDATVTVSGSGIATTSGTTNTAGGVIFVLPNKTSIYVSATAAGYGGVTAVSNTGSTQSASLVLSLYKSRVTPTLTQTPLPGETTVRPTIDPNDPSLHNGDTTPMAQEMMAFLARNGLQLVELCVLVTILAMLGIRFKFG
jgi:PKD repeat protein